MTRSLLILALVLSASARAGGVASVLERVASHDLPGTAVAAYTPKCNPVSVPGPCASGEPGHNQFSESSPREIDACVSAGHMNVNGGVDGALWAPPAAKEAIAKGGLKHALLPAPVSEVLSLSVDFDDAGMPAIAGLLGGGGPSAVTRLIVAVVVDAINAVPDGWLLSHVGDEGIESVGSTPSLADGDSTSPIVGKAIAPLVVAALNHPVVGIPKRMLHGLSSPEEAEATMRSVGLSIQAGGRGLASALAREPGR